MLELLTFFVWISWKIKLSQRKTLSYVQAEDVFISTGLSVKQIPKKMEKS